MIAEQNVAVEELEELSRASVDETSTRGEVRDGGAEADPPPQFSRPMFVSPAQAEREAALGGARGYGRFMQHVMQNPLDSGLAIALLALATVPVMVLASAALLAAFPATAIVGTLRALPFGALFFAASTALLYVTRRG